MAVGTPCTVMRSSNAVELLTQHLETTARNLEAIAPDVEAIDQRVPDALAD